MTISHAFLADDFSTMDDDALAAFSTLQSTIRLRCRGETATLRKLIRRGRQQRRPHCLAEQNVPWSRLGVAQGEPGGRDLAPTQTAYLARPASGQQDEPHRRDLD